MGRGGSFNADGTQILAEYKKLFRITNPTGKSHNSADFSTNIPAVGRDSGLVVVVVYHLELLALGFWFNFKIYQNNLLEKHTINQMKNSTRKSCPKTLYVYDLSETLFFFSNVQGIRPGWLRDVLTCLLLNFLGQKYFINI